MNKVTYEVKPPLRPQVKVGDLLLIEQTHDKNIYIVARAGMNEYALISLGTGNRFHASIFTQSSGESEDFLLYRMLTGLTWSFIKTTVTLN